MEKARKLSLLIAASLLAACGGAPPAPVAVVDPLLTELAPPEQDLEFEAARAKLEAGPVDRYVPMQWLDRARRALDSDLDPDDLRGDYLAALRWSGLAARAVLERPDDELVFEVLAEHCRIANHAGQPAQAAASLDRLRRFAQLDQVRKALVEMHALHGRLVLARLPWGSYSRRYWSFAAPELLAELEATAQNLGRLTAPPLADQQAQECWLRLHAAWASILSGASLGTVTALSRHAPGGLEASAAALEKEVLRTIWYLPTERRPLAVAQLHLRMARFHDAVGNPGKAVESIATARRLVQPLNDPNALLVIELAAADRILAPGKLVESFGVAVGGPEASLLGQPPPELAPAVPETVWRKRAAEVEPVLARAEFHFRKERKLRGLAAVWLRRGLLAAGLAQYDEAAEFYRQSEFVSRLAGDGPAAALALSHLIVVELRADHIGRAQRVAQRFFALVEAAGLTALPVELADSLLEVAGRDFDRLASPNQQLAILHIAARICERLAPGPLLLRHYTGQLHLATRFRYFEEVADLVRRSTALADRLLADASLSDPLRRSVLAARCLLVHGAASALTVQPGCDRSCLALAEAALTCSENSELAGVVNPESARRNCALARAGNGDADGSRKLLPPDDLPAQLAVAQRAGETERQVSLLKQFVADSRKELDAAMAGWPRPEGEEEGEPPPAVKAARRKLAGDLRQLAQALTDLGLSRAGAAVGTQPPEFQEALAASEEWRTLTMASASWSERPWEILTLHGRVAGALGQATAAWLSFSGAIEAARGHRQELTGLPARALFSALVAPQLRQAIRFLLGQPQQQFELPGGARLTGAQAALALHDELESYALSARLERGSAFLGRLLAGGDGVALESLEARLRTAQTEEDFALAGGEEQRTVAATKERETVEGWLEQVRTDLATKHPRLGLVRGIPVPLDPAALQAVAGKRRLALLILSGASPDSHAWLVTGETTHPFSVAASETELRLLAKEAKAGLDSGAATVPALARLHELLIAPVAGLLAPEQPLAWVPDGPLHHLPFGLLAGPERFLLEERPVLVVPSLALFLHQAALPALSPPAPTLLLLSDPRQTEALAGAESLIRSTGDYLPRLTQGAPAPPAWVAPLFPRDSALALVGAQATEPAFHGSVGPRTLLHLSAPLRPFATEPMYSGIGLAPAELGEDDGLLQAFELTVSSLTARLAVLHARGGLSEWSEAEATAGLSRALFVAGVPTVVANTTAVPEDAAEAFFGSFYPALLQGATTAAAIRTASLALKAQARFAAPGSWGAFTAYGLADTQPVARPAGK